MASIAGKPSGVLCRGNLRKAFRFSAVGLVTAGTQDCRIQLLGQHRTGIVRMLRQRPVAGFARYNHMLAKLFLLHDVGVAGFTGLVPGKRNRPGRDLAYRRASIVAVLPKTVRYDGGPQDHESQDPNHHDDCQPNEVFDVLKQARLPCGILPDAICAENCAMYLDTKDSSRER